MKIRIEMLAVVLALVGSIPTMLLAAERSNPSRTASSADDLSQLATELAEQAARLQQMQASLAESQRPESRRSDSQTTSVRWLTEASNQNEFVVSDEAAMVEPQVTGITQTAAVAPRPAALAYRAGLSAAGNTSASRVIQAQANEEVLSLSNATPSHADSGNIPNPAATEATWGAPVYNCPDSCCGDTCCDACAQGCCDSCCGVGCGCQRCCRRPCTIVAGTEAVFLAPTINGNRVSYIFQEDVTPSSVAFGPLWDDAAVDDFYVAPRIWLGVQGCKWGVLGRYFHMRVGENDFDPYNPWGQYGDHSFNANSIFEAYYTDIVLTRNFCLHGCKGQFEFGARYALIEHHESVYGRSDNIQTADPNGIDGLLTGGARANRRAHGTGLVFGLNARKPLFCNSCAHWFYSAQGSVLWGCNHNDVETDASVAILPTGAVVGSAGTINGAQSVVDDDLFIGQFQTGIQWDFALRCLPAKAFFRTAFEYQYWDASSGYAAAGSQAGVQINGTENHVVNTFAEAPGLIVDMYGLSIGTGFTW